MAQWCIRPWRGMKQSICRSRNSVSFFVSASNAYLIELLSRHRITRTYYCFFFFFGKRLAVGIETNLLDPQKYSKLHFSLLCPCLYLFSSHSFTLTLSQHKSKWALPLVWIRSQMSVCVCVCRLSFTHAAAACMDRWFVLALSLPHNRIPVLNQKLRRINQCLCQCKRNIRDDVKFRFTTQLAHITKSNQM